MKRDMKKDVVAARQAGVPLMRWLAWAARCDAKAFWAWSDPLRSVAPLSRGWANVSQHAGIGGRPEPTGERAPEPDDPRPARPVPPVPGQPAPLMPIS